jgi:hypothetical protein
MTYRITLSECYLCHQVRPHSALLRSRPTLHSNPTKLDAREPRSWPATRRPETPASETKTWLGGQAVLGGPLAKTNLVAAAEIRKYLGAAGAGEAFQTNRAVPVLVDDDCYWLLNHRALLSDRNQRLMRHHRRAEF